MRPAILARLLDREFLSVKEGLHTPVMTWGPPGVGKSQIVAQIAHAHDVPLIDVRLSQMEPSDLRGIPFRVNSTVEWAPPATLPDAQRHGDAGILFLDEITSAPPSVSAAAYQLILDRRLGDYVVPAGWAIFAAGNRQGDRGVSYVMPAPLANRFTHYTVEAHLDDWVAWAHTHDIDERLIGFLRFRPQWLFDFDAARNPVAFPSPRTWEFAHRALQKYADQPDTLRMSLQGCVGDAAGIELHAWLQHLHKMPDIDAILRGDDVAVPKEIDVLYAVASALVSRGVRTRDDPQSKVFLGRIIQYAGKFPQREMGVMVVHDLARVVGRDVYNVPEFARWAKDVAAILL